MKVEVIERECKASVGLSTELSNNEVDSVVELVKEVDKAIDNGVKQKKQASANKREYTENDSVTVGIELKTLVRIHWLLDNMTNNRSHKASGLFDAADVNYSETLCEINKKGE